MGWGVLGGVYMRDLPSRDETASRLVAVLGVECTRNRSFLLRLVYKATFLAICHFDFYDVHTNFVAFLRGKKKSVISNRKCFPILPILGV